MGGTQHDISKHRGVILLAFVGILAAVLLIMIGLRVQRSLAPGSGDTPVATEGVPKLQREVLITGLSNVWDVGFLSDDTLIFTERAGTISKLAGGQKMVLGTVPNVYAVGEGGLLGLAVDPEFSKNRYIYACYDTQQDIRISRWRVNKDVNALTEQSDIVTGLPVNTSTFPGRHSGCRPRFGADGYLWIGTGDVAIGTNPQDPSSLGGKILRVDRHGQPAPGNLGQPFDPRIHSYGHRNVQGLAMFEEPKYGLQGFSVEHGPGRDDEVNPLRSGNMGWDPVPGYNEGVPMTDKTKFPDAIEPAWRSGGSTIAPSGAAIISGERWGSLEGRLAMAVLKDQHVRLLKFNTEASVTSEEVLFKQEFGRLRSVVMGPSHAMYLTTDNGNGQDQIVRISPRQ